MPVPTHHENCKTRYWNALCPACSEPVVFFSCSCGSKVYFDEFAPPWPKHEDSCLAIRVRSLFDEGNRSAEDIRRHIEQEAVRIGGRVPDGAYRVLNELDGGRRTRRVARQFPVSKTEAEGEVFSLTPAINLFRKFDVPDTPLARQFLGTYADETYAEVTLREERDAMTGIIAEFVFLIPARLLTSAQVRQKSRVSVVLQPFSFPNSDKSFWMAAEIQRAG